MTKKRKGAALAEATPIDEHALEHSRQALSMEAPAAGAPRRIREKALALKRMSNRAAQMPFERVKATVEELELRLPERVPAWLRELMKPAPGAGGRP
jgi:hypothetical protein